MNNDEKRNITVPLSTYNLLVNDAHQFEVMKKNGHDVNMNRFLSMFLKEYYDDYSSYRKNMHDRIVDELGDSVPQNKRDEIATNIINTIILPVVKKGDDKESKKVSLKPTKETEFIIAKIEAEAGAEDSFTHYFLRMINRYCHEPRYERERIIFRSNYDLLMRCCSNKQEIAFSLKWDKKKVHTVIPYQLSVGQDETHNYLLCTEYNNEKKTDIVRVYRLNRIDSISTTYSGKSLNPDLIRYLELTKKYGSQHAINTDVNIQVKMNEFGLRMYNRIYTDRPERNSLEKTEEGYYIMGFHCSEQQVLNYFKRFSKQDSEILSPQNLRNEMISFHQSALNNYIEK